MMFVSEPILLETSVRHVHLSKKDLEILFGSSEDALHSKRELSQPGQFACHEKVDVVGPKRTLSGLTVVGPARDQTQIELSISDARAVGLDPPVRLSGDLRDSAPCKIVGPRGEIELAEGVIVMQRHIHMTPADAERFGCRNNDLVSIRVESPTRSLTFDDVIIRVSEKAGLAIHIDTDESNAAGGAAVSAAIVGNREQAEELASAYEFSF